MTLSRLFALLASALFSAAAFAGTLEIPAELAQGIDAKAVRAAAETEVPDPVSIEMPVQGRTSLSDFIGKGVTVHLKNGGRLVGILHDDTGKLWIEIGDGKFGVEFDLVSSIEVAPNKYQEFRDREASVGDADIPALWALAQWAQSKGLSSYARMTALRVIDLETDHAGARALLHEEKIGGRWLTRDQAMIAKGFIRFEGHWVTQAEHEAILSERAARQREREVRRQESEARRQARVQEERRRRAEEEARLARAHERELERLRELQKLRQLRRLRDRYGYPDRPIIIIPPHHGHTIAPGHPCPGRHR